MYFSCRGFRVDLRILLLGCALAGCGGGDELSSPAAQRLRGIAHVYLDFAAVRGVGPANEKELVVHLAAMPEFVRKEYGLDLPASQALVSPRDEQRFLVRYGLRIQQISQDSAPWLAHERVGDQGKRLVVFLNTKVECLDDVAFQKLTANGSP